MGDVKGPGIKQVPRMMTKRKEKNSWVLGHARIYKLASSGESPSVYLGVLLAGEVEMFPGTLRNVVNSFEDLEN